VRARRARASRWWPSEVKELARETADATQRITKMIGTARGQFTRHDALTAITTSFHQISDGPDLNRGAVEE